MGGSADAAVLDELEHRGCGGEGEVRILGIRREPRAAARALRDEIRAHYVV